MFATIRSHSRLLPAVVITMLCVSSVAQGQSGHSRHAHDYNRDHSRDNRDAGGTETKPSSRTSGTNSSRTKANGFGDSIAKMISACEDQSTTLKEQPLDEVSRTVQPNEDQRNALEQIRRIVIDAADTLASTCPKDIPAELSERLAKLSHAVEAIAASQMRLRPAFASFYTLLDDEQKARLAVSFARDSQPKSDQKPDRETRPVAGDHSDNAIDAEQEPACRQWAATFRSWPVRQIETAIPLTDEQHAALHEVTAAVYRAAGGVVMACPVEIRLTPLGRLDTAQKQLDALRRGIDAIEPLLAGFENSLDDAQKTRLQSVLNESVDPGSPKADVMANLNAPLGRKRHQ
jgi:hypothetical protein